MNQEWRSKAAIVWVASLLVSVTFAIPAFSQNNLAKLALMNGKCHELIIGGGDASRICEGKLVNAAYRTGKSSFQFVAKDKATVGFFGTDSTAAGDKATLKVERITLNLLMGTPSTSAAAIGTCSYTNPYAGPSLVQCTAVSGGKRFKATFVSDGRPPTVQDF